MELCKMIMQLCICIMEEWKGNGVVFIFTTKGAKGGQHKGRKGFVCFVKKPLCALWLITTENDLFLVGRPGNGGDSGEETPCTQLIILREQQVFNTKI